MSLTGSCLCGTVIHQARGAPGARHCLQCRRQSGHVRASSCVDDAQLAIHGPLRRFRSSETARRGFCPECGSAPFRKHADDPFARFSMGSVDGPTGVRLRGHIHTADKGDHDTIPAAEPQRED